MKPEIIRLHLLRPLFYLYQEPMALGFRREDEEKLFCFELDEAAAQEFLPDKTHFPGTLVFTGRVTSPDGFGEPVMELAQGAYIFSQTQGILGMDEIIELAVEVQNEGLWQRLKLAARFYVRYLFEEGRGVTQIWRAYTC
jgi:hypothetical protein